MKKTLSFILSFAFFLIIITGSISLASAIVVIPGEKIQDAIDAAEDDDVIIVHCGIYRECIDFKGKAITLKSEDPNDPNCAIIDGGNSCWVVTFSHNEGPGSVLDGFRIQNGRGGIYCYNQSSPTISKCTISENTGQGIYCYNSSSPTISESTISENTGQGIYCRNYSSPTISGCIIRGNLNSGIYCDDFCSPNISKCNITDNITSNGCGIYCRDYSSPKITHSIICNNSSNHYRGVGGGIYCYNFSSPCIINSSICYNSASGSQGKGGGIYCEWYSSPYIVNSILWGNESPNGAQVYQINNSFPHLCYCNVQEGFPGTRNIDEDPLFIDANVCDLHLQEGSFCIDAGHPRILDCDETGSDMGAYGGECGWDPNSLTITVAGDGSTEYTSIQDAFDSAAPGDIIVVSPGVYKENLIVGCKELSLVSKDGASVTFIDGSDVGPVISFFNTGSDFTLIGFTINNGTSEYGGGILCSRSLPNIIMCTISENSATSSGGGIFCINDSKPKIIECTFLDNSAEAGAGIYCDFSSPVIENSSIIRNMASGYGGGVYCKNASSPRFTECYITENKATYGAGIYSRDGNSSPRFSECSIGLNEATYGGGCYCINSAMSLTKCTIYKNTVLYDGGGVYCQSGSMKIDACDITENGASYGGGIYFNSSSPSVTNCIIDRNEAYHGGGIFCSGSSPSITNCTFNKNRVPPEEIRVASFAYALGGGIHCRDSSPSIKNCILWHDAPDEIFIESGNPQVTYSDIGLDGNQVYPGIGNINADPLFIDQNARDYHLNPNSPCIEAGTNSGAPDHDKDGNKRPQDGHMDCKDSITDMGAYELPNPYYLILTGPLGGETYCPNQLLNIIWDSNIGGNVKIEISHNGGRTWSSIAESTENDGQFSWKVNEDFSMQCRIRVTPLDCEIYTASSKTDFTIEQCTCEGDFDRDGDIDGSDLAVFAADFGRTECDTNIPLCLADSDDDCSVDLEEVKDKLLECQGMPKTCDFDCNGYYDPNDQEIIWGEIGREDCCENCWADFDKDGDVDGSDLALFTLDFGRTLCPCNPWPW